MRERLARAWGEACWALGVRADVRTLDDLIARWSEPQRHYHDVTHLDDCVQRFDAHRGLAERPGEVLTALFFHDAIYDPMRSDNEARSAELMRTSMRDAALESIDRIAQAIEATRTHVADDPDVALVLDIDLSILGADAETYDAFEHAIRAEYAHVPLDAFVAGRTAILTGFDVRAPIFHHAPLRDALERIAHANLRRTIEALRS